MHGCVRPKALDNAYGMPALARLLTWRCSFQAPAGWYARVIIEIKRFCDSGIGLARCNRVQERPADALPQRRAGLAAGFIVFSPLSQTSN
jgi:hypothetical protein